jgi:hypothetical protein
MRGRTVVAGAVLAWSLGCESGVTVDIALEVPASVASEYDAETRGLLQLDEGGGSAWSVAPVCGDALALRAYSDGFGCRPDDPDVTVRAWVVPVPAEWDAGLCDLEVDPEAAYVDLSDEALYPPDLLPAPTDGDPQDAVDARWKWTPICGGVLEAALSVE